MRLHRFCFARIELSIVSTPEVRPLLLNGVPLLADHVGLARPERGALGREMKLRLVVGVEICREYQALASLRDACKRRAGTGGIISTRRRGTPFNRPATAL